MATLLSNEQLGEIRLGVSFIPPGPVAKKFQQLLGHIDAQADLIAEQATTITQLTEQRSTLRRANGELTQLLVEERDAIAVKAPALATDLIATES